jgi:hypothetical protein
LSSTRSSELDHSGGLLVESDGHLCRQVIGTSLGYSGLCAADIDDEIRAGVIPTTTAAVTIAAPLLDIHSRIGANIGIDIGIDVISTTTLDIGTHVTAKVGVGINVISTITLDISAHITTNAGIDSGINAISDITLGNTNITLVGDGGSECRDRQNDGSDESVTHFDIGSNWSRC